jgi:hypothetical protein
MRYSSKVISKTIVGVDGTERLYKARKMGAFTVGLEGLKLARAIAPALGSGLDAMLEKQERNDQYLEPMSNTFGKMLTMLTTHISDEHWMDLSDKLLGSLLLGDDKIDVEDHFDKHNGDFLEVLLWLFNENFKDFFMQNATIRSLIDKSMALMTPKMNDMLETFKNALNEDISIQS